MALRFLLDEHLRGPLWRAIQRQAVSDGLRIDALRVGDLPQIPLSSTDADLLIWCEANGRILVTADKRTVPDHLQKHLAAGRHSPGVFIILPRASIREALEFLTLSSYASEPREWADAVHYVG